jgi:hypothetical protein
MLLSPLLAEVLSSNVPILTFFQPITFLLFFTIGYGIPVVIIRDLWVRRKLGLLQMFLIGFGYGIYNEGLFSRTLLFPFHAGVDSYTTYGLVGDVRVPFVLALCAWHALYSVIFPIIFVHYIFPQSADKPWLNVKVAWILGLLCVAAGVYGFTHANGFPYPGNSNDLILIGASWLFLYAMRYLLPRRPTIEFGRGGSVRSPAIFGALLFVFLYLIPLVLSSMPVAPQVFYIYIAAAWLAFGYLMLRRGRYSPREAVALALGGEIALACFATLIGLASVRIDLLVVCAITICIGLFLLYRLRLSFAN